MYSGVLQCQVGHKAHTAAGVVAAREEEEALTHASN